MIKKFEIETLDDLDKSISTIWELIKSFECKTILLKGPMGAGKTTFVSALIKYLGSDDVVSSPTFSLVNQYILPNNEDVFHFDCFRIKNIAEAFDAGLEEYFYHNSWCFVEWPEKIEQLLPEKFIEVHLETNGLKRYISVSTKNAK